MITIIITGYREPKIWKAIEAAQNQKTNQKYDILISAPDKETLDIAGRYRADTRIKIFKDPGKGKNVALNILLKKVRGDILILTDADVYISPNAVEDIAKIFEEDKNLSCISGQPIPIEDRSTKYGYWANFLFSAANSLRSSLFKKKAFLEASGYLFSFRKELISSIPLDVCEDGVIPYRCVERGYRVGYCSKAKVYVKNVDNWKDWLLQKRRTAKAHETLDKYVDTKSTKKVKSFATEARGIGLLFSYPKTPMEFWWTIELICARGIMWFLVWYDTKIRGKHYNDNWERSESAR